MRFHSTNVSPKTTPYISSLTLSTAIASLAMFNRTINHFGLANGTLPLTEDLSSTGDAKATHTEAFVALPSSTGSSGTASSGPGTSASSTVLTSTPSSAANRAVYRPW
jgi:hypothetical protein